MLILWLIVYIAAHAHSPDTTALAIQHWENHHVLLTVLILIFLA